MDIKEAGNQLRMLEKQYRAAMIVAETLASVGDLEAKKNELNSEIAKLEGALEQKRTEFEELSQTLHKHSEDLSRIQIEHREFKASAEKEKADHEEALERDKVRILEDAQAEADSKIAAATETCDEIGEATVAAAKELTDIVERKKVIEKEITELKERLG